MNQEWRDLGNNIRDIIQDAVNSQDFKKLNQTVKSAINSAMEGVEKGVSSVHAQYVRQEATDRPPVRRPLFAEKLLTRERMGGIALSVCGYILGVGTALAMAVLTMTGLIVGGMAGFWIADVCLLPFFIAGTFMACRGSGKMAMAKRFRRYVSALHGRTYCECRVLSEQVGKSRAYVVRDLKRMIQKGWFLEGHLDDQETCLIVDDATYHQYRETVLQAAREAEAVEAKKAGAGTETGRGPESGGEADAVIQAGEDFLKKIRACNEEIPGVEISEKISRMELVIERIFDRVRKHPENVDDIRKLMEYYLPTTVKLLEAYEELDRQPVQGENILSSKREIENTLDTLNLAFEKLLDGLFQETAWDVSTDISVLKTLLAQEGLAENQFAENTSRQV